MYLPPLQPVSNPDIYVSGNVTIHPSAAIAPGAILQAAPDSRIVIKEGVCIGMGTILNAYQGTIEIERGTILGAGVLIIGSAKIGSNSSIGAATTIFNASVKSRQIVPAGYLIGDSSRQVPGFSDNQAVKSDRSSLKDIEIPLPESDTVVQVNASMNGEAFNKDEFTHKSISQEETDFTQAEVANNQASLIDTEIPIAEPETTTEEPEVEVSESTTPIQEEQQQKNVPIFGKLYVNELLVTIFPHGQNLNPSSQDNQSS
ncbi:MAG: hypothetical protein AB4038_14375 [Prochloraceae cyanobacterium]